MKAYVRFAVVSGYAYFGDEIRYGLPTLATTRRLAPPVRLDTLFAKGTIMNRIDIHQYDYVQITGINRSFRREECLPGTRLPEVGDVAAVIEIYNQPELGYELESVNDDGETNWLVTVSPTDLEFEKAAPITQGKKS